MLGGAVSPPTTIETRYDPRGNMVYKSDVGRYWYDPARPNRLTNITLDSYPGALPNTGKRALSYVFDDYRPDAKPVNGIPLGNGNLMYTVSHDAVSGKHSARFEAYTSFNMPREISYSNIDAALDPTLAAAVARQGAATGNPAGITSDRTLAFVYGPEHQRTKQTVTLSNNAPTTLNPGTTWYLNGEDGQSLTYEKEIKTITVNGANGPVKTQVTEHKHYLHVGGISVGMYIQREGPMVGAGSTAAPVPATPVCPAGYSLSADKVTCSQTLTTIPKVSYGCTPSLGVLNNQDCVLAVTENIPASATGYYCPVSKSEVATLAATTCTVKLLEAPVTSAGKFGTTVTSCSADRFGAPAERIGAMCVKQTSTRPATAQYACPAPSTNPSIAFTLSGTTCTRTVTTTSSAAIYTCANNETLVGTGLASTCRSTRIANPSYYTCPAGYGNRHCGRALGLRRLG